MNSTTNVCLYMIGIWTVIFMKVLDKPIDVITCTKENGTMIPFKFRITENEERYAYNLKVLNSEKDNNHYGKKLIT